MEMLDRDIWAKTFDDIIKSQLQVIMTNTVDECHQMIIRLI